MFFHRLKERIKSMGKGKLLFRIMCVLMSVFFVITVFKVVWFLKNRQAIKKYLEKEKEQKQLIFAESQEGKTERTKGKDVSGEDISGIVRYAGMVRIFYAGDEKSRMVVYEVKAAKAELLKFYKKEMSSGGWKEDKELSLKKQVLTYIKGNREVQIMVNSGKFNKNKIATVVFLSQNVEKQQE
jgi:preprotein translocase subunit SecG